MKAMSRRVCLALLLALAAGTIASCGGSGAGTGAETGATTAAGTGTGAETAATAGTGAPADPGGQGTAAASCPPEAQGAQIAFWNGWSGPDGKFAQDLVNRFNQENGRGVQVQMTIQPFTEYYNKLNAAAASNTLPEIAQIHLDQIATQAARGLIRPLPPEALAAAGVAEGDYPEAVWQQGEYNGQRYSVPLDIHPLVMFYNKQLLQQAGLDAPPQTREEFEQAVGALTNDSVMGWSVTTGFPIVPMFQTLLHQFGGSEFNEDGTEVTFNSEAGVRALQYLKDAQTKYARPNLPVDAGVSALKQGNAAVEWNGIWQTSNLVDSLEFGAAAPIPQIGEQPAVWAGSHQLALTKQQNEDPAKTAAAVCFIGWFAQNSVEWAKAGQIPASNTVRGSEAFQQIEPQATIAPSAEYAFFPPPVPGISDVLGGPQAPLEQAVVNVMTGKETDIQKALDDAAAKAKQILEQNQQRYGGQ